jgi:hypothetical protein
MSETASDASQPRRVNGGRGAVVPAAEVRTYYDKPIIKEPVWTSEVPLYFFTGGMAGASAVLAGVAQATGHRELARTARLVGAAALLPSPALLTMDLGRPERFHHMLRVFKPTSPMSVGSWTLVGFSAAHGTATLLAELGWLPRLRALAEVIAAALGPVMSTYTAVLLSNTAVPVWHEARRDLWPPGARWSSWRPSRSCGGGSASWESPTTWPTPDASRRPPSGSPGPVGCWRGSRADRGR